MRAAKGPRDHGCTVERAHVGKRLRAPRGKAAQRRQAARLSPNRAASPKAQQGRAGLKVDAQRTKNNSPDLHVAQRDPGRPGGARRHSRTLRTHGHPHAPTHTKHTHGGPVIYGAYTRMMAPATRRMFFGVAMPHVGGRAGAAVYLSTFIVVEAVGVCAPRPARKTSWTRCLAPLLPPAGTRVQLGIFGPTHTHRSPTHISVPKMHLDVNILLRTGAEPPRPTRCTE